MEFARDKLRRNIVNLLDEYEAMLILLGQMNIKIRRHLDSQRVKVDELTKLQLQNAEKELNSLLIKVRRQYGAMAANWRVHENCQAITSRARRCGTIDARTFCCRNVSKVPENS
jgi:hypothetical protein